MDHSDYIVCSIMRISIGLKRVKLYVYACEISTILPCTGSDALLISYLFSFLTLFCQHSALQIGFSSLVYASALSCAFYMCCYIF